MTTIYPPDQKAAVMALLERNRGNVPFTAQQTGIPLRTLYSWQEAIAPYMQQYAPPPAPAVEVPAFESDMDTLKFVRRQIMNEIAKIAASLGEGGPTATPYQRAHVLSNLIDKIMKLDAHIKPYTGEMVVRIVRVQRPLPVDDPSQPPINYGSRWKGTESDEPIP